jgi:hypothetical protein
MTRHGRPKVPLSYQKSTMYAYGIVYMSNRTVRVRALQTAESFLFSSDKSQRPT